jgi:ribose transport system substrate-binding protein
MKRYSFLFVSIFVIAGLLLSGATALGSDTKYTIGVSAQLVSHDWSIQAKEGIQEEAKRQGVETVLLSAGQDPAKQLTDIEALIERDVNGAIILLAETSVLEKGVNRLRQAGIPVIYVDGGYEAPGVIQNISSDNYDIGRRAAYYLINQLGTKFNIVLQTYPVLTATEERTKGFKAVAEHFPGIKILEEQPLLGPEWVEQAQQHAERMLAKYAGQINAFGVCSDLFATGSSAGIDSAGLSDKIVVTGTDGLSQILERISTQTSSMRMTFLQDSKTMGVTAVQTLVKFLDAGGQIPQTGKQIVGPVVQVPAVMVTRENASNYVKK